MAFFSAVDFLSNCLLRVLFPFFGASLLAAEHNNDEDDNDGIFVGLIADSQSQLFSYILSILFRRQDAIDVLQKTYIAL